MKGDILRIGNASIVGAREGEKPYEPVGEDVENYEEQKISFLRKNGNSQHDVHMKIIQQHNEELIKKAMFDNLLSKFKNKKPILTKGQKIQAFFDSIKTMCVKAEVPLWVN